MGKLLGYLSPIISVAEIILFIICYFYIMIKEGRIPNFPLLTLILFHLVYNWRCVVSVNCFLEPSDAVENPADSHRITIGLDTEINDRKKCPKCKILQPARCHHCPLCERCVDVRDHHCYFMGTCIGKQNRSYFVLFCFYAGTGCLIASYYYLNYFIQLLSSTNLDESWLYFFFPYNVAVYLLSGMNHSIVLLSGVIHFAITTGIGVLFLFAWQMFLISQDLTSYESHKIKLRSLSLQKAFFNLRCCLGEYWIVRFLIPLAYSEQKFYFWKIKDMLKVA